jgi:pimeloyl-ACP methyl ester carboxylesterase
LRKNTPPELAQIGVTELVDHFEGIIRALPEPPILIGHSFGGLIVQQLLDRGVGNAGVALDSVAPEGVFALDWSVLKANTSVLFKWMNWDKVLTMSFPDFQYAFVNTFPEEEQQNYYDRYVCQRRDASFSRRRLRPWTPSTRSTSTSRIMSARRSY